MKKLVVLILIIVLLSGCTRVETITIIEPNPNDVIIYIEDPELMVGQEKIDNPGSVGRVENVYQVSYGWFNREIKRELISSKILSQSSERVVRQGIREEKVVYQTITEPFKVEYVEDSSLKYQEEVVVQAGVAGEVVLTLREIYLNKELFETKEIKREVVRKTQPKIIHTNTQEPSNEYENIDNKDLSWWYRPGKPISNIDPSVKALIDKYRVYWQIPTSEKIVFLTFDQGYEHNQNTSSILDTLKEKQVKVTFFVTGSYVDENPELIQRMQREGHQIGNHTVHHYRAAPTLDQDLQKYIRDIKDLEDKVVQLTKLHRPPEGGYSERSLSILKDLGYTTVFWSFAYRDWLTDHQPDPSVALKTIVDQLHPGSVILLHSVSDTNTSILGRVIDQARAKGYRFELLKP